MATRSTIAMEQPNGNIMQIYCHWDGYLSNNGEILQEHYRDRAKVLALMLLGDLSSLRAEIGEAHDFDARYTDGDVKENWCTAYGRDRGERDTHARVFLDFDDYRANHQYEEYEYVFRLDDQWYVSQYGREYQPLVEAIEAERVAEDQ
jgi:hypothetical protein